MSQHDNLEMIPDNIALEKHFSVSTILSMMFKLILVSELRRWSFCVVLTPKVGAIRELHADSPFGQDADYAMLNEVHLLANSSLSNDVISRLEDLEAELG